MVWLPFWSTLDQPRFWCFCGDSVRHFRKVVYTDICTGTDTYTGFRIKGCIKMSTHIFKMNDLVKVIKTNIFCILFFVEIGTACKKVIKHLKQYNIIKFCQYVKFWPKLPKTKQKYQIWRTHPFYQNKDINLLK